jgi:hypothetical protein
MSARTFMTCELFEQAEDLDHYVCDSLRERDGNLGSCWSGASTLTATRLRHRMGSTGQWICSANPSPMKTLTATR